MFDFEGGWTPDKDREDNELGPIDPVKFEENLRFVLKQTKEFAISKADINWDAFDDPECVAAIEVVRGDFVRWPMAERENLYVEILTGLAQNTSPLSPDSADQFGRMTIDMLQFYSLEHLIEMYDSVKNTLESI